MNFVDVASIILAAGESVRMGFPKALLPAHGKTFLQAVLDHHREVFPETIVVLGSEHDRILEATRLDPARVLINPDPEKGTLSSLQLALQKLEPRRGVLVHPVDHPLVDAATLRKLLEAHARVPACILIPEFRGRKGHPVLFPQRFIRDLKEAPLEEGARWVVGRSRAWVQRVAVDDPGILLNIDTPGEYEEIFGHRDLTRPGEA